MTSLVHAHLVHGGITIVQQTLSKNNPLQIYRFKPFLRNETWQLLLFHSDDVSNLASLLSALAQLDVAEHPFDAGARS